MKNDSPGGTPVQVVAGPADVLSAGSPSALRLAKSFLPQETELIPATAITAPSFTY
ncbi:MAG: hypothetical protein Q7J85_05830 [Bacillota bacterium]|nr:hypothetical protein [Bacillota bacterium]